MQIIYFWFLAGIIDSPHSPYCFSDGETFISADDLRINLWNLEISNQSFNIVDVKPANMEDLTGKLCLVSLQILFLLVTFENRDSSNW